MAACNDAGMCYEHLELLDEFTIECREEIAQDIKKIAENAIVWAGKYFKIPCPHVGDGKIGRSWYEIH